MIALAWLFGVLALGAGMSSGSDAWMGLGEVAAVLGLWTLGRRVVPNPAGMPTIGAALLGGGVWAFLLGPRNRPGGISFGSDLFEMLLEIVSMSAASAIVVGVALSYLHTTWRGSRGRPPKPGRPYYPATVGPAFGARRSGPT